MGKPAKIETAVTAEPAIGALIRASASAAMVCVGAVGLRHFQPGRVGSTAAAVAASARCPVAIIRARRDADGRTEDAEDIVVDVDGSPDNGVLLGAAVEEARVRKAALRAIIFRRPGPGGEATDTDGTGRALADLDRRLARWKRRHPDLRVESVAVTGGLLEYLACHRDSVRLLVLGAHNHKHVSELVGPAGSAILRDTDCSLLVVDQRHL
nr:universal stress protein [Mycobacterium sp.]